MAENVDGFAELAFETLVACAKKADVAHFFNTPHTELVVFVADDTSTPAAGAGHAEFVGTEHVKVLAGNAL